MSKTNNKYEVIAVKVPKDAIPILEKLSKGTNLPIETCASLALSIGLVCPTCAIKNEGKSIAEAVGHKFNSQEEFDLLFIM